MKTIELPPHVKMEDEMDFGQLWAPVNLEALARAGLGRPLDRSEILACLPESDRSGVIAAMKDGFHPVLLLDLETGAAAIEMRKHTQPLYAGSRN